MSDSWYALHVRPSFERNVCNHLENKGYEVFLPTYLSTRRWSDRVKPVTLPLFPSYVFSRFDILKRLPILVTPGVNFIVGTGRSPVAVDPQEIFAIRCVLGAGVAAEPWPYLETGEIVRVEEGPLKGLDGIVVREQGSDHLVISVTLLKRSVSVEIERRCVRPVCKSHLELIEHYSSA